MNNLRRKSVIVEKKLLSPLSQELAFSLTPCDENMRHSYVFELNSRKMKVNACSESSLCGQQVGDVVYCIMRMQWERRVERRFDRPEVVKQAGRHAIRLTEDGHSLSLPPVAKTNGSLTLATHPSRYTSLSDRFALSLSIQSHIGVFFFFT